MSTAARPGPALDVSGTPGVPFGRLVRVELRKMVDTRAGVWLLVIIGVVTALVVGLVVGFAPDDGRVFGTYLASTATPQGFLLPVLGVLLVTSEWGQRAALTTFTLVPHRGRIIAAKVVAAVLVGLAAVVLAMLLAAAATVVAGGADPWDGVGAGDLGGFALLQTLGILQGLAFGMVFLNSAAAIVTYFVLPIAFSIVTSLVEWFRDAQPWIDLGTAQTPLLEGDPLTGEQWAQLAVTTLLWIVLPGVAGAARVLRSEVK